MMNRLTPLLIGLLISGTALAQEPLLLDESCTATVGNQTVLVDADGTFIVRNIPVFRSRIGGEVTQLFRVRATCLRNGEMVTGQSEFFSLVRAETTFIADVFPSELDPIPVAVRVSASEEVVPRGESVQLTVIAEFADGSTEDITQRLAGTIYLSSNSRFLTVNEDGLVTGINDTEGPQNVVLTALNEGNLSIVSLTAVGFPSDLDNDGLPNEYEELFGLDPLVNDGGFDLDGDGLTNLQEFEIGTLPNDIDTDLDGVIDGLDADPLRPDEQPPLVDLLFPLEGRTFFEGETLPIRAAVSDDGLLDGVDFRVNDASLEILDAPPYELLFTVPFEATTLDFEVQATDSLGNSTSVTRSFTVLPDPLTQVEGTFFDPLGDPLAGADVALRLRGMVGEFFDFDMPLAAMPDLSGLTPDLVRPVSALNFRNPDRLLSPDTFGVGLTPDFAARFTGRLDIAESGIYTFVLGADDGARLSIDGALVAEVVAGNGFTEAMGTIALPAGELPLTVEYFQALDAAELRLAFAGPDARPSAVPPSNLVQSPALFTTTTEADGTFSIADVPVALGEIRAEATTMVDGEENVGLTLPVDPVPGGTTELEPVSVAQAFCLELANPGFEDVPQPGQTWFVDNQGDGNWFRQTGILTPLSGIVVPPPPEGSWAAMTDMSSSGRHLIFQDFTLPGAPPAILKFQLYLRNRADRWIVPASGTLSHEEGPNQHVRIDIMDPAAPVDDVGAGVLMNIFTAREGDPLTRGYDTMTADLSAFAGQTVRLRFAEVDTEFFLHMGIDDVSICSAAGTSSTAGSLRVGTPLKSTSAGEFETLKEPPESGPNPDVGYRRKIP